MWREEPTELVTPQRASAIADVVAEEAGHVTGYVLADRMVYTSQGLHAAAWNAVMNDERVRAILEEIRLEAFKAGWESSGEGHNGEHPDSGVRWDQMVGRQEYERWLASGESA